MGLGVRDRATVRLRWLTGAAWAVVLAASTSSSGAEPPAPPVAEGPAVAPAAPPGAARPTERWIQRYRPTTRHRLELGVFGGVFVPNRSHELYSPGTPWQPYGRAAGSIGLRVAYLPIPYVGAELDAAVMPTTLSDGTGRATLFAVRGHVIGQLPLASVVPFVLVGAGGLGARSGLLGSDVDLASHFGGGVKLFVHRYVGVRLDVRGTVGVRATRHRRLAASCIRSCCSASASRSACAGATATATACYDPGQRARPESTPAPTQPAACATAAAPTATSTRSPDPDDRCPAEPGLGERRGCPRLRDGDRDHVFDPGQVDIPPPGGDKLPGPRGAPGVHRLPGARQRRRRRGRQPDDACVGEREVWNGFKDDDGCPDEVPVDVAALIGTLRGITFAFMSDTITEARGRRSTTRST
jgi:OOP family OmpA-OmpF porin